MFYFVITSIILIYMLIEPCVNPDSDAGPHNEFASASSPQSNADTQMSMALNYYGNKGSEDRLKSQKYKFKVLCNKTKTTKNVLRRLFLIFKYSTH